MDLFRHHFDDEHRVVVVGKREHAMGQTSNDGAFHRVRRARAGIVGMG